MSCVCSVYYMFVQRTRDNFMHNVCGADREAFCVRNTRTQNGWRPNTLRCCCCCYGGCRWLVWHYATISMKCRILINNAGDECKFYCKICERTMCRNDRHSCGIFVCPVMRCFRFFAEARVLERVALDVHLSHKQTQTHTQTNFVISERTLNSLRTRHISQLMTNQTNKHKHSQQPFVRSPSLSIACLLMDDAVTLRSSSLALIRCAAAAAAAAAVAAATAAADVDAVAEDAVEAAALLAVRWS